MVASNPPEGTRAQPEQPFESAILTRLLPIVMLTAAVGMTAFLAVAFRSPATTVLGGAAIVAASAFIVATRVGNRTARLVLSAVLLVAAVSLAVAMYFATNRNPSAFIFAGFMLLSTAGALYSGFSNESKR